MSALAGRGLFYVAQRDTEVLRWNMEIRNIRHKGLRQLVEKNNPRNLPSNYLVKITMIMALLIDMESIDEVYDLPKYKPHLLSGDRSGTYSFHVSQNWRITFGYDEERDELVDVDYEDYH